MSAPTSDTEEVTDRMPVFYLAVIGGPYGHQLLKCNKAGQLLNWTPDPNSDANNEMLEEIKGIMEGAEFDDGPGRDFAGSLTFWVGREHEDLSEDAPRAGIDLFTRAFGSFTNCLQYITDEDGVAGKCALREDAEGNCNLQVVDMAEQACALWSKWHEEGDKDGHCMICQDPDKRLVSPREARNDQSDYTREPAAMFPCSHVVGLECLEAWMEQALTKWVGDHEEEFLGLRGRLDDVPKWQPSCPYCRRRFRFMSFRIARRAQGDRVFFW